MDEKKEYVDNEALEENIPVGYDEIFFIFVTFVVYATLASESDAALVFMGVGLFEMLIPLLVRYVDSRLFTLACFQYLAAAVTVPFVLLSLTIFTFIFPMEGFIFMDTFKLAKLKFFILQWNMLWTLAVFIVWFGRMFRTHEFMIKQNMKLRKDARNYDLGPIRQNTLHYVMNWISVTIFMLAADLTFANQALFCLVVVFIIFETVMAISYHLMDPWIMFVHVVFQSMFSFVLLLINCFLTFYYFYPKPAAEFLDSYTMKEYTELFTTKTMVLTSAFSAFWSIRLLMSQDLMIETATDGRLKERQMARYMQLLEVL